MLEMLIPTILTSASDSLNPIAIMQQFVLQGMVKKPRHIWFFILPTGLVNLTGGFLAYFGLISAISGVFDSLLISYGKTLFTLELILGVVLLIAASYILQNSKIKRLKQQTDCGSAGNVGDEADIKGKIRSVSPPALILLGAGATLSELTTALPYFAFMAILFGRHLSIIEVSVILVLYNFIYMLPLIILYFVYIKAQSSFDRFYRFLKKHITRLSGIIIPAAAAIIGALLLFHSISALTA